MVEFPGPGTAALFAAALGIYASGQVKQGQPFFLILAFSLLSLGTGVAIEYTDPQRRCMNWRQKLPLTLAGIAVIILLAIAVIYGI